jgi:N-acetylneuraminate synthase
VIRTIAEIGINHNGDFKSAIRLQEAAAESGCWAVKYQIRTNFHACTPRNLWNTTRHWQGEDLPYLEYRKRLEFDDKQFRELYDHAKSLGLEWFASCWDVDSVARLSAIGREYVKVASAHVTHEGILKAIAAHRFRRVILSTGMSTEEQVLTAIETLQIRSSVIVLHAVSAYPCPLQAINLRRIQRLASHYYCVDDIEAVGYSGHETGILPSLYAAVLGATYIERHLTLDKNQEGSDHKASLEPQEMKELCDRLAEVETILGSPEIQPLPEEQPSIEKLRVA